MTTETIKLHHREPQDAAAVRYGGAWWIRRHYPSYADPREVVEIRVRLLGRRGAWRAVVTGPGETRSLTIEDPGAGFVLRMVELADECSDFEHHWPDVALRAAFKEPAP
jgi:hypothetical protein